MAASHRIDATVAHYEWNNTIPPRLVAEPGDTLVLDTRDAADGYYTATSTSRDTAARGPFKGHPLTGPVSIRGARPGDVLVVDILEVRPAAAFGWTHIRPGRGLLPEADFPESFLQIWDVSDGAVARMRARSGTRVMVPQAPFPGVIGTALDEPGSHSTMPPRKNGGNMDVKQLTVGTTVYLPVWVEGALLSVGDAHAAQGDGEVCVSAVEMSAHVTLRVGLRQGRPLREPQLRTPGQPARGAEFATTAHGPDLFAAAQQAVRYLIEHLVAERGLTREEASSTGSGPRTPSTAIAWGSTCSPGTTTSPPSSVTRASGRAGGVFTRWRAGKSPRSGKDRPRSLAGRPVFRAMPVRHAPCMG